MSTSERVPFPYTARPVSPSASRRLNAAYPLHQREGLALFGPSGFMLPSDAGPFLEEYYNTPVDSDDIWIVTLPKCGTTWTQEMVWLIQHGCDYSGAESLLCPDRYHFLEIPALQPPALRHEIQQGENPVSKRLIFTDIRERPKPWFVKTHLPLHLCPPKLLDTAKTIYVARNPKDTCVSYFNHLEMFEERDPEMSLEEFVDLFIAGEATLMPFFPHVLEAWNLRHNPNMLFLFFEDLKRDLRGSIVKVANFLGKKLSDEQIDSLESHLSFQSMKTNPWVNKNMTYAYTHLTREQLAAREAARPASQFMRKGETGDWKRHFSKEMSQKMDAWIERELAGTDLKFVTELRIE